MVGGSISKCIGVSRADRFVCCGTALLYQKPKSISSQSPINVTFPQLYKSPSYLLGLATFKPISTDVINFNE
jgi:hypothetical protein